MRGVAGTADFQINVVSMMIEGIQNIVRHFVRNEHHYDIKALLTKLSRAQKSKLSVIHSSKLFDYVLFQEQTFGGSFLWWVAAGLSALFLPKEEGLNEHQKSAQRFLKGLLVKIIANWARGGVVPDINQSPRKGCNAGKSVLWIAASLVKLDQPALLQVIIAHWRLHQANINLGPYKDPAINPDVSVLFFAAHLCDKNKYNPLMKKIIETWDVLTPKPECNLLLLESALQWAKKGQIMLLVMLCIKQLRQVTDLFEKQRPKDRGDIITTLKECAKPHDALQYKAFIAAATYFTKKDSEISKLEIVRSSITWDGYLRAQLEGGGDEAGSGLSADRRLWLGLDYPGHPDILSKVGMAFDTDASI